MTPEDVLGRYWGYTGFRECQREIIGSVLDGTDTIGLLPTGGGKSVTFQVPAMMLDGVTLVVTPLISLMKDQVDYLRRRDVPAACLHSGMSRHEANVAMERLFLGKTKLLYLSPEKLSRADFAASIAQLPVSMIVVDEAHCISQWGYDFRPSYLKIIDLRRTFPAVPVLALTATATPQVVADIADKLGMRSPAVFSKSFSRDNLSYIVRRTEAKDEMLGQVLRGTSGSAIVYVRSRRRTAVIAAMLAEQGISADFYHAGLAPEEKEERQDAWMAGRKRVMVATNAFGMGIDKPDVRVVVHYDLPSSLEEYYQEAGRSGRDGQASYAVLLAAQADKGLLKRRLSESFPPRDYIRDIYDKLCVFLDVAMGEGYNHTFEFNVTAFCRQYGLQPRPVAAALSILTRSGVIEYGDDANSRSRLMVIMDRRDFYALRLPPDVDAILQAILRTYTGIFADFVPIDELRLSYMTSYSTEDIYQSLLLLARMRVLQYIPKRTLPYIYFPSNREEGRHIIIPRTVYEDQLERATRRMEAMRDYVFSDEGCRVERMLRYFGDPTAKPCGRCDLCRARRKRQPHDVGPALEELLDRGPLDVGDVRRRFPTVYEEAMAYLRRAADRGTLTFDGIAFTRLR